MKLSWFLFVLVIVTYCEGGLIGDFINGAHNTASAIVGGFAGQFGITGGHQRHPPQNRPHRPGNQETVVVVVEEEADPERPGYNDGGQHNQNGYGNFNRPHNGPGPNQNPNNYVHGNGYGNQNPNNFNQNHYNQGNGNGQYGVKPSHQYPQNPNNQQINPNNQQFNPQNQYNNQNSQHGRPNHHHNQHNNQFGNPNNEQGNLFDQNENSNNQGNQYGNANNNRPNNPNNQNGNFNNRPVNPNSQYGNSNTQYGNQNNQHENFNNQNENKNPNGNIDRPAYSTETPFQNQPNYQEQTTNGGQVKPPVDINEKLPGESNNKVEKTTVDPTGAETYPLFIPLSPNQYQYGGDKVEVNAPKREVDNSKSKPADDEDFQIDIRMDNPNSYKWSGNPVMSGLLIILVLTAVGKIHGQEAVASQVLHLKPLPAYHRRPVLYPEQDKFHTPAPTPRLYTNAFRPTAAENSQDNGSGRFNLTPSAVRRTEPKRKYFIPATVLAKMNRPLDIIDTAKNHRQHTNAEIKKKNIEEENLISSNDNVNLVIPPGSKTNINNIVTTTTVKPHTNVNKLPIVVDVGERSSFDGDMCPPGTVRLNGECVQKD